MAVVVATIATALTGCGQNDGTVTILAAASLVDVMPQIVTLAQKSAPDATFEVSYAGSSQIVQQLNAGADADVVVLAGEGPLSGLDPDLEVSAPTVVATNELTIALAPGNPARIDSLEDLSAGDLTLVLCAEQVPCGQAAATMFARAGITPTVASYEPDVRATLGKVTSGEADAGVVYVTDVHARDSTGSATEGSIGETMAVPEGAQVLNRYPALEVANSLAGAELVDLMVSPEGQDVLTQAGFGAP